MVYRLLPLLLLAGCAAQTERVATAVPAEAGTAAQPGAQEDTRLLAFLDAAFDARVALSPEALTGLGSRQDYDKLGDYTLEAEARELALAESQLAEMRARFNPDTLGQSARLSYALFEREVERQRSNARFRDYGFPVSTNGTPAGGIPVFLINQHKVESVFRSQVRPDADMQRLDVMGLRMYEIASGMPGFISYKDFTAEDGEALTLVEF